MDDRYTIDPPENIEFAYDIAGIGSRFLAAIIDSLVIGAALLILGIIIGIVTARSGLTGSAVGSLTAAIGAILSFLILWGYYIVFELICNGQSLGKRAIPLRVVRD